MNPRFPIYVISKGRWEKRLTVKTLEEINVLYRIVVEPSEYEKYAEVIDHKKIIITPENFSERGQGSIPVRNFVWEHSINEGSEFHWLLDDNIEGIFRFNNNLRVKCFTGTPFYIIEDFVNRYDNLVQAGMMYDFFVPEYKYQPPIMFNTRIYSCILIKNDIKFRWRGKYNEDTDLSLRILKAGYCTALFYAFCIGKKATMTQKGGNTDLIYNTGDNRLEFAKSLKKQHPDVVSVIKRFGRWHHYVDYKPFKSNLLIKKSNMNIPNEVNNYGMKLVKIKKD